MESEQNNLSHLVLATLTSGLWMHIIANIPKTEIQFILGMVDTADSILVILDTHCSMHNRASWKNLVEDV